MVMHLPYGLIPSNFTDANFTVPSYCHGTPIKPLNVTSRLQAGDSF